MIQFTNETTFRDAIRQMKAKRNGHRRYRQRKYYIKSAETEDLITVGGYYRLHIQLGDKEPVWCYNITLHKKDNTLILNDDNTLFKDFEKTDFSKVDASAIDEMGDLTQAIYNLDCVQEGVFLHF